MQLVAGTFASREVARNVLSDLAKLGIPPENMRVVEGNDRKGFEREHLLTGTAIRRGAAVGAMVGTAIFTALLLISRVDLMTLRAMALYLSGIAICTVGGAVIGGLWNLGASHDEALLFEEARELFERAPGAGAVIAAVEVLDPMAEKVAHELDVHGGRDVRSGIGKAPGWKHPYPGYDRAA